MSGFEENWEGMLLSDEAAELMFRVNQIRTEIGAFSGLYSHDGANEKAKADPYIQRRKRELEEMGADLRKRCEWQINVRRQAMADETFVYSDDPETDRFGDIDLQAEQIERIEYALVRTKTALDMLKTIP